MERFDAQTRAHMDKAEEVEEAGRRQRIAEMEREEARRQAAKEKAMASGRPYNYLEQQSSRRRVKSRRPTYWSSKAHDDGVGPVTEHETDSQTDEHEELMEMPAESIAQIAEFFDIPGQSSFSLGAMRSYIASLQGRFDAVPERKDPRPLVIHRVHDNKKKGSRRSYLDPPHWIEGQAGSQNVLAGASPISNVEAYIDKHPEVCFIVLRDYIASPNHADGSDTDGNGNIGMRPDSEMIVPVERDLASAMKAFAAFSAGKNEKSSDNDDNSDDDDVSLRDTSSSISVDDYRDAEQFSNEWIDGNGPMRFFSPYLPFYHARVAPIEAFAKTLSEDEGAYFQLLVDYITEHYEDEYSVVDDLIARSKITHEYLHYLFRPGIVLVHGRGAGASGYTCTSWLKSPSVPSSSSVAEGKHRIKTLVANLSTHPPSLTRERAPGNKRAMCKNYEVEAWHWDFDGQFIKQTRMLNLENINMSDRQRKSIDDLDVRPLEHADPETRERLRTRGEWVWKCRQQRMIAYRDVGERTHYDAGERHMIDMKTYTEIHQPQKWGMGYYRRPDQLDPDLLTMEEPPDDTFVYMAPLSMKGFNLKTKKWVDLSIDRFAEVQWNTGAFQSLVLHGKTKRLIQALISNQIEAELATDIISGKGNGIIMLLHGGPGTGKTLTAESVAEIAKKPLYPVTCGDIGTEPRDVEKYLESVLHLGKAWGCVVLLDEADVFLEQRSLEDLKRNALVSVFLRVLEYYDGILILTSNRVGTFDEAFKSRIQLAIHYTSLTNHQRTKIWENFFTRLEKLNEEGIDFTDLKDHIEDLAKHKMNGREIRNVITTARQSSRWERKQPKGENYVLNYKVMEEIIETSGKFDSYIKKLNGGMSHDQLAEDEGWRLSKEA
ncbi:AAA family ATPase [Colletotrichum sojae]|uniref:AAA family ATPase n=1 Tax=Colletotrichum sojae TaxID=2175907 RepID=A0A8H6IPB2_9PEZI|nr:AAA family ATPase [Colletotrichum sojae]